MKAAFLIRCSTKNQDLDRQTRDLTRLAKSLGYEYDIENLVFGEKITGKDDVTIKNRESIDKLLRAAKEQKFDVVLVAEVSRMSRDPASGRVYVRQLINMSIPVYFRDIDTNDLSLYLRMLLLMCYLRLYVYENPNIAFYII